MTAQTLAIPAEWTFQSDTVVAAFDAHVREQLPWYDLVTDAVAHIGRHYIPRAARVYDIGASTGNIGRALSDTIENRSAEFIAIDESPEMAEAYRGPGRLMCRNAATVVYEHFDLAICFLVLSFLSVEARRTLLGRVKEKCRNGGAIIVVDKIETGGGSYFDTVLYRLTLAGKLKSNVPAQQIIAKEMSLSGVQRPLNACELVGFREWFRFGNFAGFIYEA
jgi:tRNA (cmo5U34)-methyltransferase